MPATRKACGFRVKGAAEWRESQEGDEDGYCQEGLGMYDAGLGGAAGCGDVCGSWWVQG